MEPKWDEILKALPKVKESLSYPFVREYYRHTMPQAAEYTQRLLGGDPRKRYGDYAAKLCAAFQALDAAGIKDYLDLVEQCGTREQIEAFFERTGVHPCDIGMVYGYLGNWVLPKILYLRELVEKGDTESAIWVKVLREKGLRYNLDILEKGRTREGRHALSAETGVPADLIYDLVRRSDLTRIPFASWNTVRNYYNSGYCSIQDLAASDLPKLQEDVRRYMASIGKDSRYGMEPDGGRANAQAMPKIIELEG